MAKNQVTKKMLSEIEEKLVTVEALEAECRGCEQTIGRLMRETADYAKKAQMARRCYLNEKDLMPTLRERWITEGIPLPRAPFQYYILAGNAYQMYRESTGFAVFEEYIAALEAAGFVQHSRVEWGKCVFTCYHNDKAAVFASHVKGENVLRVSVDHLCDTALVPAEEIVDGTPNSAEPTLMLFDDHMYEAIDCGMCYVFRLHDGSLVIIDSGYHRPEILVDSLYTRLRQLSGDRPIVVSAWIFTHSHCDHIFAFNELGRKYGKEIEVKRIIHNFPGKEMLYRSMFYEGCYGENGDITKFNEAVSLFAGEHRFYRARTGQVFRFAGLQIDMLFTQEDYMMPCVLGEGPYDYNASSLELRITVAGQTYMFLGDGTTVNNNLMVARYGELLQSDVVQVAHHGFGGGTKEVYDAIKAPVVLWPCPWYDPRPNVVNRDRYNNPKWSQVTRQMVKDHAKVVYIQCLGTYILPLPLSTEHLPEVVPELKEEDLYHGSAENAD
ncbi:MAG: MBL fold metallo-hydrolase [Clostridia bacterium]|nr:MBL fold metallo-hydrolase [Clostridia bacterium]